MRSLDHWLCFLVLLVLPFCEVQAQYSLLYLQPKHIVKS